MIRNNTNGSFQGLHYKLENVILKKPFINLKCIKIVSVLLIAMVLLNSCGSFLDSSYNESEYRYPNDRMPSEPGKCYAKCLIPDRYETYEEELIIYTGDDITTEGVILETITIEPATTLWEKTKDNNCRSSNPIDCLVWCKKEVPEVSNDYYIVTDTNIVSDYKVEVISYRELIETGGYTEWKEVVCQVDKTEDFYRKIQMALIVEGFGKDLIPNGLITMQTKEALVSFQKYNGLPIGSLDFETLELLGVEY